ncbi:Spc29p Ecym_8307 [Eremothecium cymbalariae DBVPG|uniref:Spindle pole component 29 n=1 Tax=Eremothecium cymbalariae (strain CBS 270.75 / DBVPG 7215 / KCTC 17166 / NRRL Y-17582) TaxID=931890 RepID=G8JXL1_ERECY|nr:Hypothetical protein Ecym_8307 [Eremothecium cymbalariae DBVPG\
MDRSSYLNRPETDDTLQNIRKEYLNTKRNLHDLLTSSPTRIPQSTRGELGGKAAAGLQQQQGAQLAAQDAEQDDRLRQQLRDYMNNRGRHMGAPARYPSVGAAAPPAPPLLQAAGGGSAAAVAPVEGSLQRQLDNQKLMFDSLKRELDTQRTINNMLFQRLDQLEEDVRYLRHATNNKAQQQQNNNVGGNFRSVSSAPSSSHTTGFGGSSVSGDDTKVLLGWDQPSNAVKQHHPHQRSLSNFDDNTAKLIQMSSGAKQKW